jgi:hypothetical protein
MFPANAVRTPLVPVEVNGSKIGRAQVVVPVGQVVYVPMRDWLKSPRRSSSVGTVKRAVIGRLSNHCSQDEKKNSLFF